MEVCLSGLGRTQQHFENVSLPTFATGRRTTTSSKSNWRRWCRRYGPMMADEILNLCQSFRNPPPQMGERRFKPHPRRREHQPALNIGRATACCLVRGIPSIWRAVVSSSSCASRIARSESARCRRNCSTWLRHRFTASAAALTLVQFLADCWSPN
jgi:hypothetical protein